MLYDRHFTLLRIDAFDEGDCFVVDFIHTVASRERRVEIKIALLAAFVDYPLNQRKLFETVSIEEVTSGRIKLFDILLQDMIGFSVVLDKVARPSTATQCLQADRSATAEYFDKVFIHQVKLEGIEKGIL